MPAHRWRHRDPRPRPYSWSWMESRSIFGFPLNRNSAESFIYSSFGSGAEEGPGGRRASGDESEGGVFNLEFNQTGNLLACARENKSVHLYDPGTRKLLQKLDNAHSDSVNCVKFLDRHSFATCSDDCAVNLWDLRNLSTRVRQLVGHTKWVKNIEFEESRHSLLTSGFDGSVFRWDLDEYPQGETPKKVLAFQGLMRMKLAPQTDKMVLSTMNGYIIVVHDLDLDTVASDLKSLKPNAYRMYQMMEKPSTGDHWQRTPLFHAKRNRVEFISDFPSENQADMISSLKVHPQGWAAVTRNISANEETEWCCVHDIHGPAPDPDEDASIEELLSPAHLNQRPHTFARHRVLSRDDMRSTWTNEPLEGRGEGSIATGLRQLADLISSESDLSPVLREAEAHLQQQAAVRRSSPRIIVTTRRYEPEVADAASEPSFLEHPNLEAHINRIRANLLRRQQASVPPEVLTENQQRARDLAWREGQRHQRHAAARRRYRNSGRTLERADPNISEEDLRERARTASNENSFLAFAYRSMMQSTGRDPLMPAPQLVSSDSDSDGGDYLPVHVNIRAVGNRARISTSPPPSPSRPSSARIHYNTPRLTHYIEEANTGRGFIKEVSFSPEGKIVASPYGNGLRLLSFDDGCRDMCDSVNAVPRLLKAYALYEDCHSSDVLCTAFSPNHFSVVSGSKSGGIVWHDPKP